MIILVKHRKGDLVSTKNINKVVNKLYTDQNDIRIYPAIVLEVYSGYAKAKVKLLSDAKSELVLLNKSGEKLKVGENVWVYYQKNINSGWIGLRNGAPDPLVTDITIEDYKEIGIDVANQVSTTLGKMRDYAVIQGYKCPIIYDDIKWDWCYPDTYISRPKGNYWYHNDEKILTTINNYAGYILDEITLINSDGNIVNYKEKLHWSILYMGEIFYNFSGNFDDSGVYQAGCYKYGLMPIVYQYGSNFANLRIAHIAVNENGINGIFYCADELKVNLNSIEYDFLMNVIQRQELKNENK